MSNVYLNTRETRKAAVTTLKKHFKGTRFYVSAADHTLNVDWIDGPSSQEVEEALEGFASKGFDGSVDYEYHKSSWLLSDGTLVPATSGGSAITGGYDEGYDIAAPEEGAVIASPSTDYVFVARRLSLESAEETMELLKDYGIEDGAFRIIKENRGYSVIPSSPAGMQAKHKLYEILKED